MNIVCLSGRLTKKPELRSTLKTSVCQFSLAVDNNKIDENGKRGVDFIECVCFGKQAENLCKYQDKGSMIELKGNIHVDKYTNKDNKNTYKTLVYVDLINYINSTKKEATVSKNDEKDPFEEMGNKVSNDNYELPF